MEDVEKVALEKKGTDAIPIGMEGFMRRSVRRSNIVENMLDVRKIIIAI